MSNLTAVSGLLADLTLRVYFDDLRPAVKCLPAPLRLVWAAIEWVLDDAELSIRDGRLVLNVFAGPLTEPATFFAFSKRLNEPATVWLDDATTVTTPFAIMNRSGSSDLLAMDFVAGESIGLDVAWALNGEAKPWVRLGWGGNH